jgi:hypothetical protein
MIRASSKGSYAGKNQPLALKYLVFSEKKKKPAAFFF